MTELRRKLQSEVGTAGWAPLEPHYRRDALFLVDGSLDLIDAALAIAQNDTRVVQRWIEAAELVRPTAEQVQRWQTEGHGGFRFVIVQPFVLAQPLEAP